MWRIDDGQPRRVQASAMPSEKELEDFLADDASLLGTPLLVIGRQVRTPYGKLIDLLAIDADGDLHVLELKRDKTPRDVVAQLLDYGSWVSTLGREAVLEIAERHLHPRTFEAAFAEVFDDAPPDDLNNELQLTVVASELDASSERIVTYLRDFGVPVNAVFFSYLEDDDRRYLARSWLTAEDESTTAATAGGRRSKRAAWNMRDWYVSFGAGRPWEDARQHGFVSAGGGKFYSQTIRSLPVGARIWVNLPGTGFVGVGTTTGPAVRFETVEVEHGGHTVPLSTVATSSAYSAAGAPVDEDAEWVVPVTWLATRPESAAYWEKGLFASQHSACKLRQEFTLARLAAHFGVDDS